MQLHEVLETVNGGGVRLSFTLPAGGYATVVLEEFLPNIQVP